MNFKVKSSLGTLKNGGCYQITANSYQITDNSYHDNTSEIPEKYISRNFGVFVFSQVREKIKTVFFLGAIFVINNIKTTPLRSIPKVTTQLGFLVFSLQFGSRDFGAELSPGKKVLLRSE